MSPNLDRTDKRTNFNDKSHECNNEKTKYHESTINNSNYYSLLRINKQIAKSRQSTVLVFTFLLIILIVTLPESLISQNVLITTPEKHSASEKPIDSGTIIHKYKSHKNCSESDYSPITEQMINQKYIMNELTGYVPLLQNNSFNIDRTCHDISYRSVIEHSEDKPVLKDNLKTIRRQLLQRSNHWLTKELKDKRDRYFQRMKFYTSSGFNLAVHLYG